MWRSFLAGTLMLALGATLVAQERRSRIDVEHYVITAEVDPDAQTLKAEVQVRFTPLDDATSSLSFELNNALSVSSVTGESGQPLPAARLPQDEGIRVSFPEPLPKGKPATLVFRYDGALTGSEPSPIYGIKFAAIHKDFSYLLYPARWFPISGYTSDRYTYEAKITVPAGNRVVAGGTEKTEPAAAGKACYSFSTGKPEFPGSIAVVKGDPVRVSSEGVPARRRERPHVGHRQGRGDDPAAGAGHPEVHH